mmetsp:Transcript_24543/g.79344  ORF Transcript_24543/g.79344 Transcript_24543/m.79344 type:complete len:208 (-) Transcript_24543:63-686(-)
MTMMRTLMTRSGRFGGGAASSLSLTLKKKSPRLLLLPCRRRRRRRPAPRRRRRPGRGMPRRCASGGVVVGWRVRTPRSRSCRRCARLDSRRARSPRRTGREPAPCREPGTATRRAAPASSRRTAASALPSRTSPSGSRTPSRGGRRTQTAPLIGCRFSAAPPSPERPRFWTTATTPPGSRTVRPTRRRPHRRFLVLSPAKRQTAAGP